MIFDLPSTSTEELSKRLVNLRNAAGAMALTRVLTLITVVDEDNAEESIKTANAASRQHPCRVLVLVLGNKRGKARLDGQIRIGGDAGASEVIVLRLFGELIDHGRSVIIPLLLADSPIVCWWPAEGPADPGQDAIGEIAQRRITDSAQAKNFKTYLNRLAEHYSPGDTDLAWSRLTLWRGLLAAALDQPPFEQVTAATVTGATDSPSTDLLAGWLANRLKVPVRLARSDHRTGIISVRLERESGPIDLVRPEDGNVAVLSAPDSSVHAIALPHRSDAECLADELRRLDPDETYEGALRQGVPTLSHVRGTTMSAAIKSGKAPSPKESAEIAERLQQESAKKVGGEMVGGSDDDKS